uniref:Uncharacterized protein n=1 Tax=Ditylenchus dipsaci TaxID=166011 RepID=A0A915ELS0_9BILA
MTLNVEVVDGCPGQPNCRCLIPAVVQIDVEHSISCKFPYRLILHQKAAAIQKFRSLVDRENQRVHPDLAAGVLMVNSVFSPILFVDLPGSAQVSSLGPLLHQNLEDFECTFYDGACGLVDDDSLLESISADKRIFVVEIRKKPKKGFCSIQ